MNTTARQQAAAKAATMTAKLSDEALAMAWMATETGPITEESAMVRGWMMDELQKRIGDDLFDAWLMDEDAEGSTANPAAYLARAKAPAAPAPVYTLKGNRSTVHIAGLTERTTSTGTERGGVVGYYAQSACAGLTRSGHRMEQLGDFTDLADAIKHATFATYSISGRKVCKTCLAAATAALQNEG
jgi:hypothetical protein